jgi:hypothetical protein
MIDTIKLGDCQSEPVEDSRAEAPPPCFDALSMTAYF